MKILELLKGGLASAASAYAVKVSAEKRDALARSAGDALGDLVFKSGTRLDDQWLPTLARDIVTLLQTAVHSLAAHHAEAGTTTGDPGDLDIGGIPG